MIRQKCDKCGKIVTEYCMVGIHCKECDKMPNIKKYKNLYTLEVVEVFQWNGELPPPIPLTSNWDNNPMTPNKVSIKLSVGWVRVPEGCYIVRNGAGEYSLWDAVEFENIYSEINGEDKMEDGWSSAIENAFTYHPPKGDQQSLYTVIRNTARNFATYMVEECPDSRELSMAITKLEEVVMWANASIARNG